MSNIEIRSAKNIDVPRLIELMSQFYEESNYKVDDGRAEKAFRTIIKHTKLGQVLIAEYDGLRVGYIVTKYYFAMGNYDYVCSIDDLFVNVDYRDKGIGKRLIESAMNKAREKGIKNFSVDVGRSNEKALMTYRKYGFEERNKDIITMEVQET